MTQAHLTGLTQYKVSWPVQWLHACDIVRLTPLLLCSRTAAVCVFFIIVINEDKTSKSNHASSNLNSQYSGIDTSPISKYVTRPFWSFVVEVS